jgi:adenine-specific DNA methylase
MQNGRFIDPLSEEIVSRLSQDEMGKRQYYRPVYSLHKWWARRPGALFRSIILLATERSDKLFYSTSNGEISPSSDYFREYNLKDTVILDPFMGGGTTLVEANRLGAKVIGCDLNPVSHWIVKETLKPIDLIKLDRYFHRLEGTAGEKIRSLYRTHCVRCNSECDSLYSFWIRYAKCPSCGNDAFLYKRTLLNEGLSRNRPPSRDNPATAFCPRCFSLNGWHGEDGITCQACDFHFNPQVGTYDKGYFVCLQCGKRQIQLLKTLESGQKLHEKLVAIEYWCEPCNERIYKSPTSVDLAQIECIIDTFEKHKEKYVFPKQRILEGASSVRWRLHNYHYYYDVFNVRQLVAFNLLFEGMQTIPEREYKDAFITIFSNSLEYNNMMTPYNYPHRKLHHLFNYHALPLTTTPVENAVWGVGEEGAGTFVNCYHRYVKAKQYCQAPFDKYKESSGVVRTLFTKKEIISTEFVSTFKELLETPRSTLLLCKDSSQLTTIPDRMVDFVVTDPPYFDNVHYSELSNFFYVWLSCLIDHPYFSTEHVPTQQEAIVNDGMEKGEREYQDLLSAVFKESERVLKEDGSFIFTFHHTKWRAWWTVLMAITKGGFRVIDSFPVSSEYKVNPHIRNKESLDMDLVLICRKKSTPYEQLSLLSEDILQRAMRTLSRDSESSDNKLFLHFMGELLKTASSMIDSDKVDYHWFTTALTHFDDFIIALNVNKNTTIKYKIRDPLQLRLLDRETQQGSE